jgi:hypothetical protein
VAKATSLRFAKRAKEGRVDAADAAGVAARGLKEAQSVSSPIARPGSMMRMTPRPTRERPARTMLEWASLSQRRRRLR